MESAFSRTVGFDLLTKIDFMVRLFCYLIGLAFLNNSFLLSKSRMSNLQEIGSVCVIFLRFRNCFRRLPVVVFLFCNGKFFGVGRYFLKGFYDCFRGFCLSIVL